MKLYWYFKFQQGRILQSNTRNKVNYDNLFETKCINNYYTKQSTSIFVLLVFFPLKKKAPIFKAVDHIKFVFVIYHKL